MHHTLDQPFSKWVNTQRPYSAVHPNVLEKFQMMKFLKEGYPQMSENGHFLSFPSAQFAFEQTNEAI